MFVQHAYDDSDLCGVCVCVWVGVCVRVGCVCRCVWVGGVCRCVCVVIISLCASTYMYIKKCQNINFGTIITNLCTKLQQCSYSPTNIMETL